VYTFSIIYDELLVDSEFTDSSNSSDLRADGAGQDWYESRNDLPDGPGLLTLNTSDVGGNSGKKAALKGYDISDTAYLTQNFSSAQNGTFDVSLDIYIDKMSNYSDYDRTGFIFIGDDSVGTNGPCSTSSERFVYLAFYDSSPNDTGSDLEIRARENTTGNGHVWADTSTWKPVATNLSYDTWYTIKLEVDFANDIYDVYVNDFLEQDDISGYGEYVSPSLTDISFSVGGTARGDFYVDNVFAPAVVRHTLEIDIKGNGSVNLNPGESTYADGTVVELNATGDPGWIFNRWDGDLSGDNNPEYITMDGDKTVVANFTQERYNLTVIIEGNGTVSKTPDQTNYTYGTVVELNATADPGWIFSHWDGDLSGNDNPKNIIIDGNKTVTANFSSTAILEINASFDSGNIGSYTIIGNTINFTLNTEYLVNTGDEYTYWTNFKVSNVLDKEVTFRITNASAVPFLTETTEEVQMVYSYDGENWDKLTNHSYADGNYTFWETFSSNEVQIATFYPFSYEKMQDYVDTVNTSQWANKTVLGSSSQGRDIDLLTITNPNIPDTNKKIVYIIGRQHAAETSSSHMLKGMIDFLISNNTDVQRMRDSFIWYIIPMVNPDGVYLGNSRGTSEGRDPNRDWGNTESDEINIVRGHIDTIASSPGIDLFIDWHSQMNDIRWYNFIYSPTGNTFFSILSDWTDFDSQSEGGVTSCTATKCSSRSYNTGNGIFTFVFEPTPHLHTWTVDSLNQQGKYTAYAVDEYFPLLVDSEFNDSSNSTDLRDNATGQDWYESRNKAPELLILDTSDVDGNTGKKALLQGDDVPNFAYLTQELRAPQTGSFNVSLDIYIDRISIYYDDSQNRYYNRTGFIFIGDDSDGTNGPCSTSSERFAFLAFYDSTPDDTGDDLEIRARELSSQSWYRTHEWTPVATNLSYDTWYTIKLEVNVSGGTYDVYINDTLMGDKISGYLGYVSSSVTDMSFYVGGTARGDFYVDNVFAPAKDRHTLNVEVEGSGSVDVDPGESTYADGTVVELNATADPGWTFDHWSGDLSGNTNKMYIPLQ